MRLQKIDLIALLQVLLLAITPVLFSFSLQNQSLVLTRLSLIAIWFAQIFLLYRYLRRSESKLRQAVKAIQSGDDYQLLSKSKLSNIHESVLEDINTAISKFKDLKIEKEANLQFFQLVMEYVPVGIIVVAEDSQIRILNSASLELLSLEKLSDFEELEKIKPGLFEWFSNIPVDNHKILEIDHIDRSVRLSVSFNKVKVRDEIMKVYSLKDIKREVDYKELETWHNMLRILSHEVVNSVSPITLSSRSMQRNIIELKEILDSNKETDKILSDVEEGLSAISERGTGLNEFVESVQKITRIPDPVIEEFSLDQLIGESAGIMRSDMKLKKVELVKVDTGIEIKCDKKLLVQVLINLIRNSMEAFTDQEKRLIKVKGKLTGNIKTIQIEDNGSGIPEETKKQIFSPFFSTKERGSGLGLSFSRQVMRLHNGDISIWSEPGKTVFTLTFPD